MKFQSKNYFILIPFILLIGFAIGIFLPLCIHYHDLFGDFLKGKSEHYAIAMLLGLLGSTTQLSIYFSRSINSFKQSKKEEKDLPSMYLPFGYILKMIWGGLAAMFLIAATRQGLVAAFEVKSELELEAIIVISFIGGLRAYSLLKYLSGILNLSAQKKAEANKNLTNNINIDPKQKKRKEGAKKKKNKF